jgi:hypothetical protein
VKGDTGDAGPQGATGAQGVQGVKGDTGDVGATGPAGPQGAQGDVGPTGPAGPQGIQGAPCLVWRGSWSAATTYSVDDAVTYNGSSYRRLVAGTTGTDPAADAANWEQIAAKGDTGATGPAGPQGPAGLTWRGAWSAATAYVVSDAVSYGGSSYRRLVAGTTPGTPDADTTNWEILSAKGDTGATGSTGNTGATGAAGLTWQGAWVSGTTYSVNDAVTDGGSSYRRKVAGAGTTAPGSDATNWELMAEKGADGADGSTGSTGPTGPAGLTWQGAWNAGTAYAVNDAVTYLNASYRRKVAGTTGTAPSADTTNRDIIASSGTTRVKRTTTQATSASGSWITDSQLTVALQANTDYAFAALVPFQSVATTTGFVLTMAMPASPLMYSADIRVPTSKTAAVVINTSQVSPDDAAIGTGVDATNTTRLARVDGIIRTGATAGNLAVKYRTEVNGSAVTVQVGAMLEVRELP